MTEEKEIEKKPKLVFRKASELKLSKYNMRRKYNEESLKKLVQSISQLGVIVPIIITEDNTVIAGGERYTACKILEEEYERKDILIPSIIRYEDPALLSLVENLRIDPPTGDEFDNQIYFIIEKGIKADIIVKMTGESITTITRAYDRASERKKPRTLPRGITEEQEKEYTIVRRRLSPEKNKTVDKLVQQLPKDSIQLRLRVVTDLAPNVTRDTTRELTKQMRVGLTRESDIEKQLERTTKKILQKEYTIFIREDIDKKVKKRLSREVDQSFLSVIERLIEMWADYELHTKEGKLI